MPKSRPKYYEGSHQVGELVEFIGRDFDNRGIGVIIEQNKFDKNYVKVYWQKTRFFEEVHKAKLRRIPEIKYV